jgi:hypothetical protein
MRNVYDDDRRLGELGESVWTVSSSGVFEQVREPHPVVCHEAVGMVRLDDDRPHEDRKAAEKAIRDWVRLGSTLTKSELQLGIESRRRTKKPLLRRQRS